MFFQINDLRNPRYEPPWPLKENWRFSGSKGVFQKYNFEIDESLKGPGFMVKRSADDAIL